MCSEDGVHDGARKRTFPSWEPGHWVGIDCHTSGCEIIGTMSREKWEKTRALVTELADMVARAAVIQDQECKVAGKTQKQMEDAGGFSDNTANKILVFPFVDC